MIRKKIIFIAAVVSAANSVALAQPEPQPSIPLPALRAPISNVEQYEGILVDVNIKPNTSMPLHQHPGDEFLYMLAGSVSLQQDSQEPITLLAGDGFQIPAGTKHAPKSGPDGARAIVFRVHPMSEPVTVLVEDE